MKLKKNIKKIIPLIIGFLIIFFLLNILYKNIDELRAYQWQINIIFLVLFLISRYFGLIFQSIIWGTITKKNNVGIPIKKSIKIWFLSLLGRYIPGRVWLLFGRLYLAKKEGGSQYKTLLSMILELSLSIIAGILVFFISLPFWSFLMHQKTIFFFILIIMVLVGLIFLYPPIFTKSINFILKLIKKQSIVLEIKYTDILKFLFFYFIFWIILGFSFYFLINSIYPLKIHLLPAIIGIVAISWVIGFLSFLTPGGIGVREAVLSYLLSFFMPLPIAIIISLIYRICLIFIEVLMALVSLKL